MRSLIVGLTLGVNWVFAATALYFFCTGVAPEFHGAIGCAMFTVWLVLSLAAAPLYYWGGQPDEWDQE